jgi:stage III sporulation protein AD
MDILRISAAAVAVAVLAVAVRREVPVFALVAGTAMGVLILLWVMPQLKSITDMAREIGELSGEKTYIGTLFKIIGIAYIAQFASDICCDAGEQALSSKVLLAGKILVAFYGMPIVAGLIEQIRLMLM